ncbi:MAG: STAS domain-containing protein [Spirochaetes bacterium]|nr:STAS domain-containing protein [Spirochaetota bacterium]
MFDDLLKITVKDERRYILVSLVGIIDNNTYLDFVKRCTPLVNKKNVIINFQELKYISSTGIGVLLKLTSLSKMKGYRVVICALREPIIRIIKLIKMDKLFMIEESMEDAIDLINSDYKKKKK